jgi:hypothetical protein
MVVIKASNELLYLILRRDLLERTLKRLSMFVLRAKVKLKDVSEDHALMGGENPLPRPVDGVERVEHILANLLLAGLARGTTRIRGLLAMSHRGQLQAAYLVSSRWAPAASDAQRVAGLRQVRQQVQRWTIVWTRASGLSARARLLVQRLQLLLLCLHPAAGQWWQRWLLCSVG